jgi:hypothetical protein
VPAALDHNAGGTAAPKNAASPQARPFLTQVPQHFAASDATIIRSRFDSNSMRLSSLHYKIVILFPSSALPPKLSLLITGRLSPFSLIP